LNGPGTDIFELSADDLDGRCWLDDWNVVKAAEIEQRFKRAWANADVELTSSRF